MWQQRNGHNQQVVEQFIHTGVNLQRGFENVSDTFLGVKNECWAVH